MNTLEFILKLLPCHLTEQIARSQITPEEIRLRRGQPLVIRNAKQEHRFNDILISQTDMVHLMTNATNGGYHKAQDFLRQGYLPLPGGCRLGISGEGARGEIRSIKNISSVCIRIASEALGCADPILPNITYPSFENTIIIAPPGGGKTTLLREIIRKLSVHGNYIAVADERGEISGLTEGLYSFDLGPRCDVSVGIPKQKAAIMMLRSMAPDILAMDEITAFSDLDAILEAIGCGVGLLTTTHGHGITALQKPGFREIYETKAFQKVITIELREGKRHYRVERIYD